jgi:hypothetical protein
MHRRGSRARLSYGQIADIHLLERPTVVLPGEPGQAVRGTSPLYHRLRTLAKQFADSLYRKSISDGEFRGRKA